MSYKSVREILNSVFDSDDSALKGIFKTDGEVLNMVLDETGDPALKVHVSGLTQTSGGGSPIASSAMIAGTLAISGLETMKSYDAVTYTGNGTSQSIVTGMESCDFTVSGNGNGYWHDRTAGDGTIKNDAGDIVAEGNIKLTVPVSELHIKDVSSATEYHGVFDGLRGGGMGVYTNSTGVESGGNNVYFTENGFSLTSAYFNASGHICVAYQRIFTHMAWGTTNHGKMYITAYNPVTKEFLTLYIGSGTTEHQIPHMTGGLPSYWMGKSLDGAYNWRGNSSLFSINSSLEINTTDPLSTTSDYTEITSAYISLGTQPSVNESGSSTIISGFANTAYRKIVQYTGTGAAGKAVDTGFRPARVIYKRLDTADGWVVMDSRRSSFEAHMLLNSANAQTTYDILDVTSDGFTFKDSVGNVSGGTYIAIAEADTNADSGGTYVSTASEDTALSISDGILTYTDGRTGHSYNVSYEPVAGEIDLSAAPDGYLYLYKEKDGTFGWLPEEPMFDGTSTGSNYYFDISTGYWHNTAGNALSSPLSFIAKVYVSSGIPQRIEGWWLPKYLAGDMMLCGGVSLTDLPSADPYIAGYLWNDSGTVKISEEA